MKIYISTFGNLDIRDEEHSLINDETRQYRLYRLFQYFITFRNKRLLPENIIDSLFGDSEFADPKNVLRTQIFRLRQLLKDILPKVENESDYLNINFASGYYCLGMGNNVSLDADAFESLIDEGDKIVDNNTKKAKELYIEAIKLYKGVYLSENPYEIWLVPIRNYYSRLYIKTFNRLMEILKEEGRNEEIIKFCEEALVIEPYEESIYVFLIESMLILGQISNAKNLYDYATAIIEKEIGIKSSNVLNNTHRKILNYLSEKTDISISNIGGKMEDEEDGGALYCDLDHFKFLYKIQKRKTNRQNQDDLIGLITLKEDNIKQNTNEMKEWTKFITKLLQVSLRSTDTFTFWNDSQVLILLHQVSDNGREIIEKRIRERLNSKYGITINFKPLMKENILSENY